MTGATDSARELDELERAGLFLLPLDTKRDWYRYHHLFAGLLRHEFARTRPELVPVLHRRAAAWYRDAAGPRGHPARDRRRRRERASELITRALVRLPPARPHRDRRRLARRARRRRRRGDAGLCLTKAWIAVNTGGSTRSRAGSTRPSGRAGATRRSSSPAWRACTRSTATWPATSSGRAAGRRSVERGQTPWRPVGCPVLGIALFWSGRSDEAAAELESGGHGEGGG